MRSLKTDTKTLIEILKIGLFSFLCGIFIYKITLLEHMLKHSYKKVAATKQHLFYFDDKNQLDRCETLYWVLQEK